MTPTERAENVEHAEQQVTRYGRRVWIGLLVVVLAVIVAALGYTHHQIGSADDRAAVERAANGRERAANSRTINAQQQAISTLANQVRALGGTPAVTATAAPTQQPVNVAAIVGEVVTALGRPRDGRDGKDAPAPSQAQVNAAVALACAHAGCGPTDEQVAGLVAAFLFEHPPPAGPAGQDGQDGQDGADGHDGAPGRGIERIGEVTQTGSVCTFTVFFTDGTTQDLTWQCQPDATPTPEPTPTPTLPGSPLGGG